MASVGELVEQGKHDAEPFALQRSNETRRDQRGGVGDDIIVWREQQVTGSSTVSRLRREIGHEATHGPDEPSGTN